MNFAEFHFLRPVWLLLIPLCIILSYAVWRLLGKKSAWGKIVSSKLLAVLTTDRRRGKSWPAYILLCLGWLLAVVAVAGPSWERLPQPLYEQNQSRVIVFDLSLSMNSSDLQPNRLQQAKFKLMDLIQTAENKQQALIVFAGDGFIVSPFTNDAETLTNLVPSLDVDTVPVQGSRADKGLEQAASVIANADVSAVEIVLITDGANDDSIPIAKKLSTQGHSLQVLGVGTSEGAPVLLPNGSLLKDESGNIVIPTLNRAQLKELASAGGGFYADMGVGDQQISRLNSSTESLQDRFADAESTALFGDSWVDAGSWLLLPLLLISCLSFRKGWLLILVMLITPVQQEAHAFEWQDLWLTDDQQAARAMADEGELSIPEGASIDWQAAMAFKKQQFDKAVESYEALVSSEDSTATNYYNYGNALAKSNALQDALDSYEQALRLDPDMQDAIYNRDIVKELLKQQQQQQQQNNSESEKSQDQSENQEQSDDQQGGQEQQQQASESSSEQSDGATEPQDEQGESQPEADPQDSETKNTSRSEQESLQEDSLSDSDQQQELAELQQPKDTLDQSQSEEQQALEQWLKKVPDDPGGLLKRKFQHQYRLREQPAQGVSSW